MHTIFGSTMATGKFAKNSNAPIGTEDGDAEDCEDEETRKSDGDAIANEGNNGITSCAARPAGLARSTTRRRPTKRSRTDVDPLVAAIN
jgi:hypothetical protein